MKSIILKGIIPARTQSQDKKFQTSQPCEVRRSGQVTTQGGTSIFGGWGAWPQNLPLKFLLEPKILPPKIQVSNTPNFAL